MGTGLRCAVCVALVALWPVAAGAKPTPLTPKLAKDFVAGCEANSQNCRDWIAMAGMQLAFEATSRREAPVSCISAFAHVREDSAQQILAWVKARPELGETGTQEAIAPAVKQFRPASAACRNAEDDGLPTTTAAFLAHCAKEAPDARPTCDRVIDSVAAEEIVNGRLKVCLSKRAAGQPAPPYAANVRTWLAAHADAAGPSRNAGIAAGYGALYACAA